MQRDSGLQLTFWHNYVQLNYDLNSFNSLLQKGAIPVITDRSVTRLNFDHHMVGPHTLLCEQDDSYLVDKESSGSGRF